MRPAPPAVQSASPAQLAHSRYMGAATENIIVVLLAMGRKAGKGAQKCVAEASVSIGEGLRALSKGRGAAVLS